MEEAAVAVLFFSFDPSTSTFSKLKDFDNTNGAYPWWQSYEARDGKLYGMTNRGGSIAIISSAPSVLFFPLILLLPLIPR
jgi:hypothetical protein